MVQHQPAIFVSAIEFGWGSAGKLDAILAELRAVNPDILVYGLGSNLARQVLSSGVVDHWFDVESDTATLTDLVSKLRPSAALSVLDADSARRLEAAGVATVFVDSLPFLWTANDGENVPLETTTYCAQEFPGRDGTASSILTGAEGIRWVEGIIARRANETSRRPKSRSALVSLGGLHSNQELDSMAYPSLVLQPTLDAIADAGYCDVTVCGSIKPDELSRLEIRSPTGMRVRFAVLGHSDFIEAMAEAELVVTSPGLTTLLEASAISVPIVCLPPQNVSQIWNGSFQRHCTCNALVLEWPTWVVEQEVVRSASSERDGLSIMYGALTAANCKIRERVHAWLYRQLLEIRKVGGSPSSRGLAGHIGTNGARQVANHVAELAAGHRR